MGKHAPGQRRAARDDGQCFEPCGREGGKLVAVRCQRSTALRRRQSSVDHAVGAIAERAHALRSSLQARLGSAECERAQTSANELGTTGKFTA
eukprot:5493318-Pleurochrysis_carterae.AAC.1